MEAFKVQGGKGRNRNAHWQVAPSYTIPDYSALNTMAVIELGRLPVPHSQRKTLSMVLAYPGFDLPVLQYP